MTLYSAGTISALKLNPFGYTTSQVYVSRLRLGRKEAAVQQDFYRVAELSQFRYVIAEPLKEHRATVGPLKSAKCGADLLQRCIVDSGRQASACT